MYGPGIMFDPVLQFISLCDKMGIYSSRKGVAWMNHKGTITLDTPRLILRRAVDTDTFSMYQNWASDPLVTQFLTWPTHTSVDITHKVLQNWIAEYQNEQVYQWMIELKDLREPIGSIGVVALNENDGMAEIGYCIGKQWWHQGITTEALSAVIDFLFREVGCLQIEARHDPRNMHSGAVMKKCGMRYSHTMHNSDSNNQGICDTVHYVLHVSDWKPF